MAFAFAGPETAWLWLAGAVLVELRLLANMLDGMVAIARGTASRLGELFNEVPDRVADVAVLIGLGYAAGSLPWLGYLAALAALGTAYLRAVGVGLGLPGDFSGPMAKPHRMHAAAVLAILAFVTAQAGWTQDAIVGPLGLVALGLAAILAGTVATLVRRLRGIVRGLSQTRDAGTVELGE